MTRKDGIIIIDKECGTSSFGVVDSVKGMVRAKVGHAGTLDPFATGVLILLINQGTKLSHFLMSQDKVYRAALMLGVETDTQDLTGRVTKEKSVGNLSEEDIRRKALDFLGTIKQVPPAYSAVHYKGKRAYEFARNGIEVDLRERNVRVDYINVLSVDIPNVWIEVGCGSGTYIRTLASDLGRSLGVGAHLTFLRRIRSGFFSVNNAATLKEVEEHKANDNINELIIPLKDALKGIVEAEVSDKLAEKIRNGYRPLMDELRGKEMQPFSLDEYIKVVMGREMVAILKGNGKTLDIIRVFK
ncbi:MAG: tRNA pseudouridine(55) synthase TruB [Thermodesulfobacteriota bacterium]|nr:tRNA pseudouridine(55) synthase TruB [Thermodesulfobacteriota bacterium]